MEGQGIERARLNQGQLPRVVAALRRRATPYLLVAPCALLLLGMMVYPIVQNLVFSVSEVQLPSLSAQFIGLQNFGRVFASPDTLAMVAHTVIFVAVSVVARFLLGLWGALTFNAKVRGGMVLRVICLLPWTVPSVVSANLWNWILQSGNSGVLNQTLVAVGLGGAAHNWLASPQTALYAVMFAYLWTGFPFVMIMLLAGLQGIPESMYEASELDGATRLQQFRYITLPSLRAIIGVVLVLELISAVNSFDLLQVMTAGGPGNASQTISLLIYQTVFTNFDFAGGSALSVALLAIALVFFLGYSLLSRQAQKEGIA